MLRSPRRLLAVGTRAVLQDTSAGDFVRYVLGSAVAFAVDFGLLIGLTELAGWHYLPASAVGFMAGAGCLYLLSIGVIFRRRRFESASLEFALFVTIGLAGLGINQVSMFLLVSEAGLPYPVAKLFAAGTVFLFNFSSRRTLLFQSPQPRPERAR